MTFQTLLHLDQQRKSLYDFIFFTQFCKTPQTVMMIGVNNKKNNVKKTMSGKTTMMMFLSSVLTLLLSFKTSTVSCDIFSSTSHLQNLMYLERHIVTHMYNYIDEMEERLNQVKR